MDLVSPRPDLVFLRRRLHVGETVRVTEVAQDFLAVSGPDDAPPADATLPEKPRAVGRTVLTPSSPVVRLNARQSAIGSLRATGVAAFAWETVSRSTGVGDSPGMPVFSHRPLVERVGGEVVVGLRHISVLRRLVLEGGPGEIGLTVHDGATVVADTRGGLDVLYLSVIGTELEVRLETLDEQAGLSGTFSIGH